MLAKQTDTHLPFIDIRVVDQALPAYCCSWLFKISAHDNDKLVLVLFFGGQQQLGYSKRVLKISTLKDMCMCVLSAITVFFCCNGVMDGARTDNDKQPVVFLLQDGCYVLSRLDNCLFRYSRLYNT